MQPAIGDLKRRRRQYERQQREDVCEALVGAVLEELVDERALSAARSGRAAAGFPRRAADGDLAADHVEDTLVVDGISPFFDDGGQRSAALKPHFEAQILEPSSRPSTARCDTHTENTRASRRRTANG